MSIYSPRINRPYRYSPAGLQDEESLVDNFGLRIGSEDCACTYQWSNIAMKLFQSDNAYKGSACAGLTYLTHQPMEEYLIETLFS